MAVNLHTKYSDKIMSAFKEKSLFMGKLSNDYSWEGAKTVKISTPLTVAMNNYTRTGANRYGTPTEMQDMVQELTLSQDKSFSLVIDKGNNEDQNYIKEAGRAMRLQVEERAIPTYDLHVCTALAVNAGVKYGTGTAISSSNAVSRVSAGTESLDDDEIPQANRLLYCSAATFTALRLAPEWVGIDALGKESLMRGQLGEYDGMRVFKVPSARLLAGVNFMIVQKYSACAPVKINDTILHRDPPGISGNLLEGRMYYDAFVFGARCDGVYVDFNSGTLTKVATPTQNAGVFSSATAGASFKYTNDGTDPRYSATAIVAASESEAANTEIKVCAFLNGALTSDVLTYTAA